MMFVGPYSCSLFLSKNTNIQITFCINNVIYNILKTETNKTNIYIYIYIYICAVASTNYNALLVTSVI